MTEDLGVGALAHGFNGIDIQKPEDTRPYFYPIGLYCPEHWNCAEGWADREPESGFSRVDEALNGGYRFTITGNANIEYSTAPVTLSIPDGGFIGTALHEYMHHFGINSKVSFGGRTFTGIFPEPITFLTKYDQFIRHHGATPRGPSNMTLEQLDAITADAQDVRFGGPLTMLAAPLLLSSGFDNTTSSNTYGEVYLHTPNTPHSIICSSSYPLVHLAGSVEMLAEDRNAMMSVCGHGPSYLGIIAYMLADLGWGPVTDSTIAVSGEQDTATIEVAVQEALEGFDKAVADNLLVNITVPEGVFVDSADTAPADCDLDEIPFTCRYASLDSAASIALTLGGVPGVHAIKVDVDHQAMHVDPVPINNFASALVTVGENTITSTTLDDNAVPENEAVNTKVGAFVVASTGGANVSHTFSLVTGSGSTHNACFKIDGADLLTNKELDYEALSSLNIRVETLASNGFMQENTFNVSVTDVGGASAWVPSLIPRAYASRDGTERPTGSALSAVLLLLVLMLLYVAAQQGGRRTRIGAAIMLTGALLVSCGGGGGGDGAGPTAPPPPPVASFSCD